MKRTDGSALMLTVLYALLIGALLVLVLAGARLYTGMTQSREAQTARRTALSFIQTQAASARGDITLGSGPEGDMLCLRDGDYETRIYTWKGNLLAEYAPAENPVSPENAEVLCALDSLKLFRVSDNRIAIQAGEAQGQIWTAGGGEDEG